jgi:hypothetical protein
LKPYRGAESVVGGQFTPIHLEIEINTSIDDLELPDILPKTVILELVKLAQEIETFLSWFTPRY